MMVTIPQCTPWPLPWRIVCSWWRCWCCNPCAKSKTLTESVSSHVLFATVSVACPSQHVNLDPKVATLDTIKVSQVRALHSYHPPESSSWPRTLDLDISLFTYNVSAGGGERWKMARYDIFCSLTQEPSNLLSSVLSGPMRRPPHRTRWGKK